MQQNYESTLDSETLQKGRRFIKGLDAAGDFWCDGAQRSYKDLGRLLALIDENWGAFHKRLTEGGHAATLYINNERVNAVSFITVAAELIVHAMTHPRLEDAVVDKVFGDVKPLFETATSKFLDDLAEKITQLQVRFRSRRLQQWVRRDDHGDPLAGRLENLECALYLCRLGLDICEPYEHEPIVPDASRWKNLAATVRRNYAKAVIDSANEFEDEARG
jgi:hypothetical protein